MKDLELPNYDYLVDRTVIMDSLGVEYMSRSMLWDLKKIDDPWRICFYVSIRKVKYPKLNYPVNGIYESEHDLTNLPWHGGLTYYDEYKSVSNKYLYARYGIDFQHAGDPTYSYDTGEKVLREQIDIIHQPLMKILERAK